mmetsp:Transcript_107483/g.334063  ORF Transcript_107483/g.334063 Transcript_107483/m.334063 type:complete len:320 (-) Transcript_107483:15-974(-)
MRGTRASAAWPWTARPTGGTRTPCSGCWSSAPTPARAAGWSTSSRAWAPASARSLCSRAAARAALPPPGRQQRALRGPPWRSCGAACGAAARPRPWRSSTRGSGRLPLHRRHLWSSLRCCWRMLPGRATAPGCCGASWPRSRRRASASAGVRATQPATALRRRRRPSSANGRWTPLCALPWRRIPTSAPPRCCSSTALRAAGRPRGWTPRRCCARQLRGACHAWLSGLWRPGQTQTCPTHALEAQPWRGPWAQVAGPWSRCCWSSAPARTPAAASPRSWRKPRPRSRPCCGALQPGRWPKGSLPTWRAAGRMSTSTSLV